MLHNKLAVTIFIAVSFLVMSDKCIGQIFNRDSLISELNRSSSDTTTAMLLSNLAEAYVFYKPDSAFYYSTQGIELSREIDFIKGEAWNTFWLAVYNRFTGSPSQAMQLATKALTSFEDQGLSQGVIVSTQLIGWTAQDNQDLDRALEYSFKAAKLSKQNANYRLYYSYTTIAEVYLEFNKPDSALVYAKMGIDVAEERSAWPTEVLAAIHARLSHKELAFHYFRQAISTYHSTNNTIGLYNANYGLANLFATQNLTDSAVFYATAAFNAARGNNFLLGFSDITTLLSKLYSQKNNKDSTIKYLQIAIEVKDSLYSLNKVRQFQSMVFNEKLQAQELEIEKSQNQVRTRTLIFIILTGFISALVFVLYRNNKIKQQANNQLVLQKKEVEKAYDQLKATQAQLIQSEKMASLGELTAGIAHEIQNPLNFVNNFSEVNTELIDDLKKELVSGNQKSAEEIADSIKKNEEKISHHGKRADGIVKSMLQHSRSSSGQKELTDINALCDEYMRLTYHGYRAKDKSFSAEFEVNFDQSIPKVNVVPQDIGRVVLNLINNAFHTVGNRAQDSVQGYEPMVTISTKRLDGSIEIRVQDNGRGIPDDIKGKDLPTVLHHEADRSRDRIRFEFEL